LKKTKVFTKSKSGIEIMNLSSLRPAKGSVRNKKRVGRGQGSGNGTTAGKGNKGQQARSGYKRPIIEGGQVPVYRRLPKFGFTSRSRKTITTINLLQIEQWLEQGVVSNELTVQDFKTLLHASNTDYFKVLGAGEVTQPITITAHFFSKSAEEKIAAAGGKTIIAFRTLAEAVNIKGLPIEEALLKEKVKLVKVKKAKPTA